MSERAAVDEALREGYAELLLEFAIYAKGDPLLTAWEANFINDIGHKAAGGWAGRPLTERQWAVVMSIAGTIGYRGFGPTERGRRSAPNELPYDQDAEE